MNECKLSLRHYYRRDAADDLRRYWLNLTGGEGGVGVGVGVYVCACAEG